MPSGKPEGEKGEDKVTTSTKRMETILDLAMGKLQTAENLIMGPLSGSPGGGGDYRGRNFQPSTHHAAHSIRKMNVMHHKETLKGGQGYRSDQGQVWAHVANMSHAMDAPSATGAMHDVYEQKKSSFEEFGKKIRPVKGQTGAAFLVGDTFAGIDLFGGPAARKGLFQRVPS